MIELLRSRRSIRRYKAKEIEPEKIEILKEAALRSPTSRGINPWRFFFIRDRKKLEELSRAKESGSSFLKDARLGVVVCAKESESDVWIEDCSIASIIMQLTAHSLGLGSCWIQIRNRMHSADKTSEEYVREVLRLPADLRVESIIAFGYPDEVKQPMPAEDLEYGKITSD
ncbi:MAG TPA: nitroreductase family protein [Methanothrix sp.]|nr:nitroreductase family protein [Methanothrix sp.]HOK58625.1 nitroreductase family protein [Methanothrix sp.]HOL43742.1 nitroreductase family protein [Methanothrix sp.]HPO88827.1 nitroreductase family protein [Methanothrix sp.]